MISLFSSVAYADDDILCDYYDLYSRSIVTFPKTTQLGKSGPSAVSGISFIFPDQSMLTMIPGIELYYPLDPDPDSDFLRYDNVNFARQYAKAGCQVILDEDKMAKITCDNYEYTMVAADNQKYRRYISIYYDYNSNEFDSLYHSIVDSLALVYNDPSDEFRFYHAANKANDKYYFAQDAAFQELVDSYQIPVIVCGNFRIRDEILQGK